MVRHRETDATSSKIDEDGNSSIHQAKGMSEVDRKKFSFLALPGMGMICAFLSSFFFAVNALFAKLVHLQGMQLTMSRVYVQFMILLPIVFFKRDKVDVLGPVGLRRFLWLRGLTGSTATIFLYLTISNLSVGNAITITYLSMMFVPFIAKIFLRESLTALDLIFAFVSLIGVTLIAQPSFLFPNMVADEKENKEIGVMFGICSALLQATTIVILRKLGKTYPPLNVLYHSAVGSITTTILVVALQEFKLPCWNEIPFVFALGITGVLGQYFISVALSLERAGTVSVLRSVQIIMVYILQITVLDSIPSILSLIGATLILSGSIGIGIRKIVNERKQKKSKNSDKAGCPEDRE